ncbi:MAG: 2-keto-4-pentenoate hydratase [Janthinobacterium lividum]
MTGEREAVLTQTVDLLLDARRTGRTLDGLPAALTPADTEEIYAVQDRLAAAFGEIGGWKIGAPTAEATPMFAPMPLAWIAPNGSNLSGEHWRYRGLEAEIAFLVGKDLPPRAEPYLRAEVLSAMASCHPAIEVLETAFADPGAVAREAMLADLQLHGGFVHGPASTDWHSVDFNKETVALTVDGIVRVERTGSNTSGDLLKLLPWLANQGAERTGGLRAGQWITTGSWTGNTPADSGSSVSATFSTAGRVDLRFA